MNMFNVLNNHNINEKIKEYYKTEGAVLLDVRTGEEYSKGHIPNSKNIPLQIIDKAERVIGSKEVPVFVYCRSGNRSGMAKEMLKSMGFKNVENIGGIVGYNGAVEY